MLNKEQIIDVVKNKLDYISCSKCEFNGKEPACGYCKVYSNWKPSLILLEKIADEILDKSNK